MWLKWSLWLNRISTIFSDHSSELKPIDGHEIAALEEKLGYEMSDFLLPFNDIAMDTNNEPEENDDINDLQCCQVGWSEFGYDKVQIRLFAFWFG